MATQHPHAHTHGHPGAEGRWSGFASHKHHCQSPPQLGGSWLSMLVPQTDRLAAATPSCSREPTCQHAAAHVRPPSRSAWNIVHFPSPALSKQVIFLLWKDAHCSFDIKDRSSLFSLKAAIGEVKLYYADLSEGYNIIQRNDVKQKLLSSTFPTSPAYRFQAAFLPLCVPGVAGNWG